MQKATLQLIRGASRSARLAGYRPIAVRSLASTPTSFATEANRPNLPKKAGAKSKLLHAIDSEIKAEQEAEKESPNDARLDGLKEEGVWSIDELEGGNNISLTKSHGKETCVHTEPTRGLSKETHSIRITFSCQPSADEDVDDFENDTGTPLEEAEEAAAETDEVEEDADEFDDEDTVPFEATVTVQQQGKPTLVADISIGSSYLDIEGVRIFEAGQKVDLETLRTSESYEGPHFATLDPDVQQQFELYFTERGISADLFPHIEDAKAWKEQKEYTRWLGQVKSLLS